MSGTGFSEPSGGRIVLAFIVVPMNEQERHNRQVMLRRIKDVWLRGVLEESLHGAEVLDLGFAYRPSALADSEYPSWQQTAEYDYLLPVGTKIWDVFEAAGGVLLILGEPGAGKTTMLLQLVSELLERAERNEQLAVPVVFGLAGWNNGRQDGRLADWLVEELANNYEVPQKLSRAWLDQNAFIPLLDGLDEVDGRRRSACAAAINEFRRGHPGVSCLVTARSQDYQALGARLHMDKAIVLQPLTEEQIDQYLSARGKRLEGLRASLKADATLRELSRTPLMLSIMTLAYYRMPADIALSLQEREMSRRLLFDVYVERMARYRGGDKTYAPADTIHWLTWLAHRLAEAGKPIFFLEDLQPGWLSPAGREAFVRYFRTAVPALLAAPGIVAGLLALPFFGLGGLLAGLLLVALGGGLPLLTRRFLARSTFAWDRIEPVESLDWSWPWAGLGLGLGAVAGLLAGALPALIDKVSSVPWLLLVPLTGGLAGVLDNALLRAGVRLRTTPGQGIAQSGRNGRLVGSAVAGVSLALGLSAAGLAALLGRSGAFFASLPWILWSTFYLGLVGALAYGGLAYWQHRRLIAQLEADGHIPVNFVNFLNYAAERNLLRKVGGGYTFVHALLLEYFRGLDAD